MPGSDPVRERDAPPATTSTPDIRGLGRGSGANLLGSAVMAAASFVVTLAVTRGLSREQAGLFFTATSVFVLATSLGQLGTNTALVYFIPRARAAGTPGLISRYVSMALRPVVLTALAMTVVLLVGADPIARLISPDGASTTAAYLRSVALFIPLAGLENVLLAASRGMGTMRPSVLVEQVGRSLLQVVLVITAVWLSADMTLAVAWAAAYLPAAVWAVLWWRSLRRRRSSPMSDPPAPGTSTPDPSAAAPLTSEVGDRDLRRDFWRFSGPRALASVGQMTMQRLDIILVAAMAGAVAAAIYTAATRFVVVGQMANRAISTAVQPRLSHALARGDIAGTNHLYRVSTSWLMVLAWPLYLSLMVYGNDLLGLFGRGYQTGHSVLVILAASMLFATSCGMVDMVLNMGGRTTWNLANVTLALVVNLGLDIWLIPSMGFLGAAIGWAAAIFVSNLAALLQVGLILRLHPFGRSTVLAALLPLACYAVLPVALGPLLGDGTRHLVVGLVLATLVYGGLLFWARRPLELTALLSIRRRGAARRAG